MGSPLQITDDLGGGQGEREREIERRERERRGEGRQAGRGISSKKTQIRGVAYSRLHILHRGKTF